MKRSLLLLAVCALSSAVYAQSGAEQYTREQVLEVFSNYNPVVLENAKNNENYEAVLEAFISSYDKPVTAQNRFELIAVARNFDNSLLLRLWENSYKEILSMGSYAGTNISAQKQTARQDLLLIFGRIWANSVQLREMQLQEAKEALKKTRKDKTISKSLKQEKTDFLKDEIADLKSEIKALRKNPGEQIQQITDSYMAQLEQEVAAAFSSRKTEEESSQTENLQVKTNHKKPVAK